MDSGNKTVIKNIAGMIVFILLIILIYHVYGFLSERYKPESDTLSSPTQGISMTSEDKNKNEKTPARVKSPDFIVYNRAGEEVISSDFVGKPIVINFWATWCPYCKDEMREFNDVYLDVKDDVHFMMINQTDGVSETFSKAEAYINKEGFDFPVYYDYDFSASAAYGIQYLPTTIFIDSEGYIVNSHSGPMSESDLSEHIEDLIK